MSEQDIRMEKFSGPAIRPWLPELARLRIEVFREFPYLYDGSEEYERAYLQTYVDSAGSLLIAAFDGDRMVGASTCCPLVDEDEAFRSPFEAAGLDVATVFYCGESVLLRSHRGRGIYRTFFAERENRARDLGGFEVITFCAVERPVGHPRRPAGYRPHDAFWTRIGYRRRNDLRTRFPWKDLDEPGETLKPMVFWVKRLTEE